MSRASLASKAERLQRLGDLVQDGMVVDGRGHLPGLAVGDLDHGPAQDLAGPGFRQSVHDNGTLEVEIDTNTKVVMERSGISLEYTRALLQPQQQQQKK